MKPSKGEIETLLAEGRLDRAIELLRGVPDRSPRDSRYLAWLEQRRGDYEGSTRTLERLLVEHPDDREAQLLAASASWHAGRLGEARSALERLASRTGDDPQLAARVAGDLGTLTEVMRELEPVAAAERRLETAFWASVVLVAGVALWNVLRALRKDRG